MKYIVSISGGKDSTACLIWALETLPKKDIIPIYIDTQWEHHSLYKYLEYLEKELNIEIIRLGSEGFENLAIRKKMIPNPIMRFCTYELKVKPALEFYKTIKEDFIVITGVRRDESESRKDTECFSISLEGHKILNPIAYWDTQRVFDYLKEHKIKPNPLYLKGFERVGCYPCIYARKHEIQMMEPEYKDRVRALEKKVGAKFFHPAKQKYMYPTLDFDLGCINQYGQCE